MEGVPFDEVDSTSLVFQFFFSYDAENGKKERLMNCRRWLTLALVLTLSFFTVQACDKQDDSESHPATETASMEPAYGGALVEGTIGDASNLIPMLASDTSSRDIINLVYNGLVKYDKDMSLVGDLAESWEVSEDGKIITFHLHKKVNWHDGSPFTAQDVLFTYQVMVDEKTPTAYGNDFLQVEKAEAVDDYTFQVTYSRPFAPALASWGMGIVPKHLLEGRDITQSPLARNPVGTGPYTFHRWVPGQDIVLRANPDYFEGKPYIAENRTRVIPDMATMFLELKAGGVDLMSLTPLQFTRQTEDPAFASHFNKYSYLSNAYVYLGYNLLNPKFSDKTVRQAISYAVNKQQILDGVLLGLGEPSSGPYKPGSWSYNPNVKKYPHDPAKAKELLAEAGWTDTDEDGILDKDGKPFEFTILTNEGNENRKKAAIIIQQNLSDVGIKVGIRTVEWSTFLKEFIDKKDFEALVMGWTIPADPDLFDVWHSTKTRQGELNFISYKNEEVDRLIEEGRYTFDQEKRKAAYYRIQEILAEEQPYTFLYVPRALVAVSSRVQGIEPSANGIAYNRVKWYVPAGLQKYSVDQ